MNFRAHRQARVRTIRSRFRRFGDDRHWRRVIATVEDAERDAGDAASPMVPYHLSPDGEHFDPEFATTLAGSMLAEVAEMEREKIRRQGPGSGFFRSRFSNHAFHAPGRRNRWTA